MYNAIRSFLLFCFGSNRPGLNQHILNLNSIAMLKIFSGSMVSLILTIPAFAQQLPNLFAMSYSQATTTMGTTTTTDDVKKECLLFKREGSKVTAYKCSSSVEKSIIYQISGIEKEKNSEGIYSITYFGYDYIFGDPVSSFLTFGYSSKTSKWTILIEDVFDDPKVGTFRVLTKYFNIE